MDPRSALISRYIDAVVTEDWRAADRYAPAVAGDPELRRSAVFFLAIMPSAGGPARVDLREHVVALARALDLDHGCDC